MIGASSFAAVIRQTDSVGTVDRDEQRPMPMQQQGEITHHQVRCLIGFSCTIATPFFAWEETVMLMLGGKFCNAYLKDVRDALTNVDGVKAIDLKSMKGHAVVTVDSSKVGSLCRRKGIS